MSGEICATLTGSRINRSIPVTFRVQDETTESKLAMLTLLSDSTIAIIIGLEYRITPSVLQRSFDPPDGSPVCVNLFAEVDDFVEPSELLSLIVSSSDSAVVLSPEDTTQISIEDSSIGITKFVIMIDMIHTMHV